jgi:hypothetical protein
MEQDQEIPISLLSQYAGEDPSAHSDISCINDMRVNNPTWLCCKYRMDFSAASKKSSFTMWRSEESSWRTQPNSTIKSSRVNLL